MKLRLVAQSFTKEVDIAWLELSTQEGNCVIQPGHAPIILKLSRGKKITYCIDTGKQESLIIPSGIADITREKATIIINERASKE